MRVLAPTANIPATVKTTRRSYACDLPQANTESHREERTVGLAFDNGRDESSLSHHPESPDRCCNADIIEAIGEARGLIAVVARKIGIPRMTIYRRIQDAPGGCDPRT